MVKLIDMNLFKRTGSKKDSTLERPESVAQYMLGPNKRYRGEGHGGRYLAYEEFDEFVEEKQAPQPVPDPEPQAPEPTPEPTPENTADPISNAGDVDLSKMKKDELIAHANGIGVSVDETMTKKTIIQAIEATE